MLSGFELYPRWVPLFSEKSSTVPYMVRLVIYEGKQNDYLEMCFFYAVLGWAYTVYHAEELAEFSISFS